MQPWCLFRTFLTKTFCMQPENRNKSKHISRGWTVTNLVSPELGGVGVERTVVVGLPQQGLDGEKNGADLWNKLNQMNFSLYIKFMETNQIYSYIILRIFWLKTLAVRPFTEHIMCYLCHDIHLVQSRPLLLEYVEADVSVSVHIRVEAGGWESHGGWLVGVACGELQPQLELEALVDRVLGPLDCAHPGEQVVPVGEGGDALVPGHHETHQLAL